MRSLINPCYYLDFPNEDHEDGCLFVSLWCTRALHAENHPVLRHGKRMIRARNDMDRCKHYHCMNFRCTFVCSVEMLRMDKCLRCILCIGKINCKLKTVFFPSPFFSTNTPFPSALKLPESLELLFRLLWQRTA